MAVVRAGVWVVACFASVSLTACSATDMVGSPTVTAVDTLSPDAVKSPQGALDFYHGVLVLQASALRDLVLSSGFLTDELRASGSADVALDARRVPTAGGDIGGLFTALNRVRANARQARGILAEYRPADSRSLVGHLYAVEAMTDVMLAELFCSGIPLSTVEYGGDAVARPGSSSEEVYRTAVALFDSALTLSSDSAALVNFAKVGKGRALLGLGDVGAAARAVAGVPTDYQYRVEYAPNDPGGGNGFARASATSPYCDISCVNPFAAGSGEGETGMLYATSGDWRTDSAQVDIGQPVPSANFRYRVARKYDASGTTPIILASGVEARLIEAEAQLRASPGAGTWLATLNALRATCTNASPCSSVLVPGVDTVLPPLTDPGAGLSDSAATAARVGLLFAERAAWLYLTGHRQGDLRRLVRRVESGGYGRPQQQVYPTGVYAPPAGAFDAKPLLYGGDVTLPVPETERVNNSQYRGCLSRDA